MENGCNASRRCWWIQRRLDSAYLATSPPTSGRGPRVGGDRPKRIVSDAQWATARAVAEQAGLQVVEGGLDEMRDPRYVANPTNRCYFCKDELWKVLRRVADARGMATIVDGTNADDLADWRPGAQAAREHGVHSPLADLGLTKADIRLLSRERGLPTWAQPSSPCLSSRIPYGTPVTAARLAAVERADRRCVPWVSTPTCGCAITAISPAWSCRGTSSSAGWTTTGCAALTRGARCRLLRVSIDLRGFRSGSLNVLSGVTSA